MKKLISLIGGIFLCLLNSYAFPNSSLDSIKSEKKGIDQLSKIKIGDGAISLNLYGDFGYVVGPQKTYTYYDPIKGDTVTDYGRRDFTSFPLYANQFSLSYGFIQAQYEIENRLKFKLALHTGHIVDALYLEETPSTKFIRELSLYYHLIQNGRWKSGFSLPILVLKLS